MVFILEFRAWALKLIIGSGRFWMDIVSLEDCYWGVGLGSNASCMCIGGLESRLAVMMRKLAREQQESLFQHHRFFRVIDVHVALHLIVHEVSSF